MKCPCCKKQSQLKVAEIEMGLNAYKCDECQGTWISRNAYDKWRATHDITNDSAQESRIDVDDIQRAKICPQCGHILLKYRIGHGLSFYLDYCSACGGVWLDRNEWDAIKAKNIHGNIHDVVTDKWQEDIRSSAIQKKIEDTYAERLGTEKYKKAKDFRDWLEQQPEYRLIMSYLGLIKTQK